MGDDERDSVHGDERAEAAAEARDHQDDPPEHGCPNKRNHSRGFCYQCGLGMSR